MQDFYSWNTHLQYPNSEEAIALRIETQAILNHTIILTHIPNSIYFYKKRPYMDTQPNFNERFCKWITQLYPVSIKKLFFQCTSNQQWTGLLFPLWGTQEDKQENRPQFKAGLGCTVSPDQPELQETSVSCAKHNNKTTKNRQGLKRQLRLKVCTLQGDLISGCQQFTHMYT